MITRTFICDICKESVGELDLIKVETNILISRPNGNRHISCNKDICVSCLEKKGFITKETLNNAEHEKLQQANQKTIETKLFELLEDLGVVFE